jgi:pyruvate,water dikinase
LRLAADIRQRLEDVVLPADLAEAITSAVAEFGQTTPLAVRSSATAEDLPFASFAGQQETFLNIVGTVAVLEAVKRCWASLWTDRAVVYRANNQIDQRSVRLAVVIQLLVDAAAAGVLFTADPLTGRRQHAVIEASAGLGEAVVSGAVNPDHWLVDSLAGAALEGPSDGVLTRPQLQELTRLGQRIEQHFGAPQDIEFAVDKQGTSWIVQSRAITTLYPLPEPTDPRDLHVYLSFNVAQGVFRPLTPMGIDAFRVFSIAMAALFGIERTTSVLKEAGGRLFIDLTAAVRSKFWRRVVRFALSQGEARSGVLIERLMDDPRLAPRPSHRPEGLGRVAHALRRTLLPPRVVGAWLAPGRARRRLMQARREVRDWPTPPPTATAAERVDAAESMLRTWPSVVIPRLAPVMIGGLAAFGLAHRLAGADAAGEDFDAVRRALPYNPTTEMDLALWRLAEAVRKDADARAVLGQQSAAELAAAYGASSLPPTLQRGLAAFLAEYGHRAIAEIDIGLPRWSDDPSPLLAHLANYLELDESAQSPEAQFQAAAAEAEAALRRIVGRVALRSRFRAGVVRFLLRRGRALAGFREMPKFLVVLILAHARAQLGLVGRELAARDALSAPDDVFFLTFDDVRRALSGVDQRSTVAERRARYAEEMRRRHVPRLLLSDGTEPRLAVEQLDSADGNVLRGTPASAGTVSGRARVILDPAGARLVPGEILVAPSTDPGWTPLFLTAGGLVMEMGGAMSHGAVVAREYGIPAVVGVPAATERITDGEHISVDGSAGTVQVAISD